MGARVIPFSLKNQQVPSASAWRTCCGSGLSTPSTAATNFTCGEVPLPAVAFSFCSKQEEKVLFIYVASRGDRRPAHGATPVQTVNHNYQVILEDLVVLLDNLEQDYTEAELLRWAAEKYVREYSVELPENYG